MQDERVSLLLGVAGVAKAWDYLATRKIEHIDSRWDRVHLGFAQQWCKVIPLPGIMMVAYEFIRLTPTLAIDFDDDSHTKLFRAPDHKLTSQYPCDHC